jgi:hypothetical protein
VTESLLLAVLHAYHLSISAALWLLWICCLGDTERSERCSYASNCTLVGKGLCELNKNDCMRGGQQLHRPYPRLGDSGKAIKYILQEYPFQIPAYLHSL